jgi:MtN3 and saliva related transmembrane protein
MADSLAPFAAAYGVLMAISPVRQIRRMLQTKSSTDVSIGYLAVIEIGFGLWVLYGVSLPNWALAIPNGVPTLVGLVTIVIALRLRRPRSAA